MELEHRRNPEVPRKRNKLGMAMLFEWFLPEQKPRVQQPPKCERTLACPPMAGKIDLSEKIARFITVVLLLPRGYA